MISWKSLSLTFLALDIFVWCCHFLLIRLAPDISESWQPFLWTALEPETGHTLLSWQAFSDVTAVSWNRCRFNRFPLTCLSLGILIFGHLFFLRHASLDILFSPHLILLTPFLLGTIFLVFCCFTLLFGDLFLLKLFPLTPSVLTSPLSWGNCSFSNLFLLTSTLRPKFILCTTRLAQSPSCTTKYLPKAFPSTTSYYKACTKYFPVLLCTTKLHKRLPSTTPYYKACTKYFPVLLRSNSLHKVLPSTTSYYKACTKTTSQYYFVLQSLHKVLPSTTLYYKPSTNYFPVQLRTTTLAQSTSQYYFVLQSLHKVLPSTTSYYKACTKYFPVQLRTTKLAQSTFQYYFALQRLHRVLPSTTS